jgi:hypothetical protein
MVTIKISYKILESGVYRNITKATAKKLIESLEYVCEEDTLHLAWEFINADEEFIFIFRKATKAEYCERRRTCEGCKFISTCQ